MNNQTWEQTVIEGFLSSPYEIDQAPASDKVTKLLGFIGKGKEKAIPRRTLKGLMGLSDRATRKVIEEARNCGYNIVNIDGGSGYYIPDDIDDKVKFYKQEYARAISILRRLKTLRKDLKAAGCLPQ